MAAIAVSETHINAIKKALRDEFLDEKSSHLSEALAAALGYRTHAALLADLPKLAEDPPIVMLSTENFVSRLHQLGYPRDDEFDFDYLDQRPEVIRTFSLHFDHVEYESDRGKAWRNIVVCAVNEGIRTKSFSLRKDDNRCRVPARCTLRKVRTIGSTTRGFGFPSSCPMACPRKPSSETLVGVNWKFWWP